MGEGGMRWPCRGSMDGRGVCMCEERFSEAQWTLLRAAGSLFPCPVNRTSLTRIDNVGQLANPHKPSLRNVYPTQCGGEGLLHLVTNGRARFYCYEANRTLLFVPGPSLSSVTFPPPFLSSQMNWMNAKSMFRYCLLPSLLFLLQAFVILIEHWLAGLLVFIYKYSIFWFWFVAALTECNLFNLCFSFPKNDAL